MNQVKHPLTLFSHFPDTRVIFYSRFRTSEQTASCADSNIKCLLCWDLAPLQKAPSGSSALSLGYPTRKWVVEPPSPSWSHHRRHTAAAAGMMLAAGEPQELEQIWDHVTIPAKRYLLRFTLREKKKRKKRKKRGRKEKRSVSNMMEEIDRFQVPSAVQEAEMQAEMQPLVSPVSRLWCDGEDRSGIRDRPLM